MMKRPVQFLAAALILGARIVVGAWPLRQAHAATAYPNAASNYVFTTPLWPTRIRGDVMGDPPAYYVPRTEDEDWIFEALAERKFTFYEGAGATRPRFDAPGLSGSKDVARQLWNPNRDVSGYLDPDVALISGDRPCRFEGTFTNVYSVASYTNAVTNVTSYISTTLANGTRSVHTNSYRYTQSSPCEITYTNVLSKSAIDYCKQGDGFFPGYTNVPPLSGVVHVPAAFSNAYAALRGATRLADVYVHCTNQFESISKSYADGRVYVTTNSAANQFRFSVGGYSGASVGMDEDGSDEYSEYSSSEETAYASMPTGVCWTRFETAAVTSGATRVEVEAVFALARFYYNSNDTAPDFSHDDVPTSADLVMRLDGALDTSGGRTCVRITPDMRAMAARASSAAGAPTPPTTAEGYVVPIKYRPTERWTSAYSTRSWSLYFDNFIIFYRVRPTSRLEGW